ncbi:hypothetical protein EIP86_001111 [Pleurotus ostreatoroseus]|nr:hypothetical protein EIP86_001111 [Pleurotus ostreatoroseus]
MASHTYTRRRRASQPRRLTDEERWNNYRRNILGYPSEFDTWLSSRIQRTGDRGSDKHPTPEDVRCYLVVERIKGEEEGPFANPDILNLYIRAHVSPELMVPSCNRVSPSAIYHRFVGSGNEMEAPDWAQWEIGIEHPIWLKRGWTANVFMGLALQRQNLELPGLSVAMIEWALAVSIDTPEEEIVKQRAKRRGFQVRE